MTRVCAAVMAALLGAAGVGPAAPPAAAATEHRVTAAVNIYLPGELTVAAGDSLVLWNLDQDLHDVMARDFDENGQPYFRSATTGFNGTVAVHGVPALVPSEYPFFCTVHQHMTGVLVVR